METMHAAGRRRLPPVPRPAGDRATGQLTVERPRPTSLDAPDPAVEEPVVDRSDTELIDTRQIASELIDAELTALTETARPPAGDGTPADDAGADVRDESDDTEQIQLSADAAEVAADAAPEVAEPAVEEPPTDTDTADADPDPDPDPEPAAARPEVAQDPAQQFVARLRSSAADFAGAAGAESAVVREAVPPARHRRARCRLVLRYADDHVADVTFLGPAGAPGRPSRHGFDRQILRWLSAGPSPDDAWLVADPDAPDGVAVDLSAWAAAG